MHIQVYIVVFGGGAPIGAEGGDGSHVTAQFASALEFLLGNALPGDDVLGGHGSHILPLSLLPQGGEAVPPQTKYFFGKSPQPSLNKPPSQACPERSGVAA
jgi:hypothetical protein